MENPTLYQLTRTKRRAITSCLTCRRRKVYCDHESPTCTACLRGGHVCAYAAVPTPTQQQTTSRVSKPSQRSSHSELNRRLEKLEGLLERALGASENGADILSTNHNSTTSSEDCQASISLLSSRSSAVSDNLGSINNRGDMLSSDGYDGTLLLKGDQSHFVSSLHWALLADEIHDIKTLVSHQTQDEAAANRDPETVRSSFPSLSSMPKPTTTDIALLLPETNEACLELLDIFFANVDPFTRLVHKPSLTYRFSEYIHHVKPLSGSLGNLEAPFVEPNSRILFNQFETLAFAIFYAAINSIMPHDAFTLFGSEKSYLLQRYKSGLEMTLERENFICSSSIEVLQAFVLLLTCQCREDDMTTVWPLVGLAIRIATSQGLHREPSLFPSGNMNSIQVELRRRLWHQIVYLDFRSAEGKGQEPSISDDDFTTLLPRNVNDSDLTNDHVFPFSGSDGDIFTDMTPHLVRLIGIQCFRKMVRSTYQAERRLRLSGLHGRPQINPVLELQTLVLNGRQTVNDTLEMLRNRYLRHFDADTPLQRLTLGYAKILEWKCWVIFWLRIPRDYREVVMSTEFRNEILTKSVLLLESMHHVMNDKDGQPFLWHIGGHSCFQAIMHIISELRTSEFKKTENAVLRTRALGALRMAKDTWKAESSSTWIVIRRMIDDMMAQEQQRGLPATTQHTKFTPESLPDVFPLGNSSDKVSSASQKDPAPDVHSAASNVLGQNDFSLLDMPFTSPILPQLGTSDFEIPQSIGTEDSSSNFDWGFWNVDTADLVDPLFSEGNR